MQKIKLMISTLALVASAGLVAQTFPSKPVKLVVPFPAGGVGDLVARTISTKLAANLGQSVVVENKSRNIIAYVGGTDYWGRAGQVDLAARARSPGSALKPFIYGLAFDNLLLHPASRMEDVPTTFGDYAPRDFDGVFLEVRDGSGDGDADAFGNDVGADAVGLAEQGDKFFAAKTEQGI